ncbi:MAG: tetratricopeptide repeat protein [Candidatus Eisenbacteria bacterium]|nr:tetratricopeptide repeat protein [Candidatus Eisenbacteria bacterium]MCC7141200.1 tetratricopeptide repeat protein [Candidatus Eisenbacteria bacterium]
MSRLPGFRARLGWVLLLGALSTGCGDTPLASRYAAEKSLFRARKLLIRIANKPEAAETTRTEAIAALERLLEEYPLTRVGSDARERRALGEVRVASAAHLAVLYRETKQQQKGIRLLSSMRGETKGEPELALRIHGDLIALLSRPLQPDSLALVLREVAEDLEPCLPDGRPIPLVLTAPLQVVDLLESTGQTARAAVELEAARAYYDDVVRRYPGREVEVAARLQAVKVALKQGDLGDADGDLSAAAALSGAGPYEAAILFSQGSVRLQVKRDARGAIAAFSEMVRKYPDDRNAPEAMLQIGASLNALGQPDSAIAYLGRVEGAYPRDPSAAASARLAIARVQGQQKRWAEAIRTLRGLTAEYPRTAPGLLAPLEVVAAVRASADAAASKAALLEAATTYERLANDLAADPASRAMTPIALDHLAEVYEELGDWNKAVNALMTRAQNFPDDVRSPLVYVHAAGLQAEMLKDRAAAIRTLELLVGRYPDLPLSEQARTKIEQLKGNS